MVDAGPYVLSVLLLALLVGSLGWSAVQLRRRLLPTWHGPPAYLVDSVTAVGLLIALSELLGLFGLLDTWPLILSSLILSAAIRISPSLSSSPPTGGASSATPPSAADTSPASASPAGGVDTEVPSRVSEGSSVAATGPAGRKLSVLIALGAITTVFALWGLTTADALGRGIFNFDSLWYHVPFSIEIAQSHSVTGFHHPETVFTNWFYPQNSELLGAVAILLTERDTLILFLNFAWLALAFLAAWCIGRPYGLAPHSAIAAAIVLGSYTLVVREPGAAKNDVMAAALLLAAIAILLNAYARRPGISTAGRSHWALAAAGLAVGLAAGTKVTVLAMAAVLTLAVVVLARGWRWRALGWWTVPALIGGGFWYLRNLIAVGNPLPQIERIGPISLPHPEQLQSGRPDFSVAHYATDTAVWREYFFPGLEHAFGLLWPLVLGAAVLATAVAIAQRHDRALRWAGIVALAGLLAYAVTPLGAAGLEGAPEAFRINLRFLVPALLAALVLLPPAAIRGRAQPLASWTLLAALTLTFLITTRADTALRDPDRLAGWALATLFVLVPAALIWARHQGASRRAVAAGFAVLALTIAAIGYPVQRSYLDSRFANADPARSIPGMDVNNAYRWVRGVEDSRIGLVGTTAGFFGLGFYGTDLSNRVVYLGAEGPQGAFNPITTCKAFRTAVNAADLDYLVTAPFLNFIRPGQPIPSPESRWLSSDPAATPINRSGPVTIWQINGPLDPLTCPDNARAVPNHPQ